ncbi:MAG: hypothetical protein V4579_00820 [Pseudomonadota bacterium]
MATANPARSRKWLRRLGWLVLACTVAVLVYYWRPLRAYGLTGASYAARIGCSCRFVAGRPLGDCRQDFEPGMRFIMLSEDPAARSITARVPLVASQTATFHAGAGCILEPWSD